MGRWIYARWAVSVSEVEAAMRRSRATVRWAGACAPKARTGGSIKSAENRHRVLEPREQAGERAEWYTGRIGVGKNLGKEVGSVGARGAVEGFDARERSRSRFRRGDGLRLKKWGRH